MIQNPNEIGGFAGVKFPDSVEIKNRHFDIEVGDVQNSFSKTLSKAIEGVDQSMKTSEQGVQDYMSGKTDNVHEVMINMQRAQLSFQLLTEVRNKEVEAYQEISRMQI